MRVAVISDIHGNLHALEAVLSDIRKHDVNSIVCLGDIVGKGPNSREALDVCRNVCDYIVKGNWEWLLCNYYYQKIPESNAALQWYCDSLGAENMNFINTLPHIREMRLGEKLVRLFHAHPLNFSRYYADSPYEKRVELLGYDPDNTIMKKKSDIAVYADIHAAYMQEINYSILINTGSVGNPLDITLPSYVILEAENDSKGFSVQFMRTPYDMEGAIRTAENSGMPDIINYVTELRTAKYCRRQL